jgi:hypothetical protein
LIVCCQTSEYIPPTAEIYFIIYYYLVSQKKACSCQHGQPS